MRSPVVPSTEAPDERAQRIVDWLCDESFNFAIESPKTGETERQAHGIPQGPDISAFLANVALFGLDYELQKIVNTLDKRAREEHGSDPDNGAICGGVYARYVDDMVLVARTPHDLSRMRSAVERQLATRGLTLSPKTAPLPPMDKSAFREWLTSERGAALGASGIYEGPPSTDAFIVTDPLLDAGNINRGDSLQILHSAGLENPLVSAAEVRAAIQTARLARDLRHGDRAKAAQHIWRCVLKPEAGGGPATPDEAARRFAEIWDKTGDQSLLATGRGEGSEPRRLPTFSPGLRGLIGC